MPNISRIHDFQPGSKALSSQVDEEFNQLITTINSLPDKDGTLQTNLNADLLDGFQASINGGINTIPVCNGVVQVALNADKLDGLDAGEISGAAFDVGTKLVAYQATAPGGWALETAPTDHILRWKTGQAGGVLAANSWNISGITVTVNGTVLTLDNLPQHTHSLNNHTHTMAEHTHEMQHTHPFTVHDNGAVSHYMVSLTIGNTLASPGAGSAFDLALNSEPFTTNNANRTDTDGPNTNVTGGPSSNVTGIEGLDTPHTHTATAAGNGSWRPPTAYISVIRKL